MLLGFDPISLAQVFRTQIYAGYSIDSITFDPSNFIILASKQTSQVVGYSTYKKDFYYMYLHIKPTKWDGVD